MPLSVAETYKNNLQTHVPFITGWNSDEGFLLGINSKENFAKQGAEFGKDSNQFRKYFPSLTDSQSVSSKSLLVWQKHSACPNISGH